MRKTHDERRDEILDAAEQLFYTKGYADTSIAELIAKVQIAKGTFYYYFQSKEEVMYAVVHRYIDQEAAKYQAVIVRPDLTALEKFRAVFLLSRPTEQNLRRMEVIDTLHHTNAEIHMESLIESFKVLKPMITGLLEQGVSEKVFQIEHVSVTAELMITGLQFLFHDGFFPCTDAQRYARLCDFVDICEDLLKAGRGTLSFIKQICKE